MNRFGRSLLAMLIACAAIVWMTRIIHADDAPLDQSAPASQPSNGAAVKSPEELWAEFNLTNRQLAAMMPPEILSNPDKRAEFAGRAIPLVYHRLELSDALGATKQLAPLTLIKMRSLSQALLYLLEDQRTVSRVNSMIASIDPTRKLSGQIIQVNANWLGAGNDKDKQAPVADAMEKLDRANPVDIRLTQLTLTMADAAKSPDVEDRLLNLVADVMLDPYARTQKPTLKAQLENREKQRQFLDKPIVIAGKTIEGDDFSSTNWKGKVVLVDFWATWCAPCRAELPHVLEIYNQYHSKGLEIVGISSDSTAKPLQDFMSQNSFPWTQLFDPQTAQLKLHPMCAQFNVAELPAMYLIDKQGNLRSISAWKQMDDMIPQLLAEGDPTTQKTK